MSETFPDADAGVTCAQGCQCPRGTAELHHETGVSDIFESSELAADTREPHGAFVPKGDGKGVLEMRPAAI